jgi:hypothetical protein
LGMQWTGVVPFLVPIHDGSIILSFLQLQYYTHVLIGMLITTLPHSLSRRPCLHGHEVNHRFLAWIYVK